MSKDVSLNIAPISANPPSSQEHSRRSFLGLVVTSTVLAGLVYMGLSSVAEQGIKKRVSFQGDPEDPSFRSETLGLNDTVGWVILRKDGGTSSGSLEITRIGEGDIGFRANEPTLLLVGNVYQASGNIEVGGSIIAKDAAQYSWFIGKVKQTLPANGQVVIDYYPNPESHNNSPTGFDRRA